jgi:hypothetical protein
MGAATQLDDSGVTTRGDGHARAVRRRRQHQTYGEGYEGARVISPLWRHVSGRRLCFIATVLECFSDSVKTLEESTVSLSL